MTSSADVWVTTTDITRAYLEGDHEEALRVTDALLWRHPGAGGRTVKSPR